MNLFKHVSIRILETQHFWGSRVDKAHNHALLAEVTIKFFCMRHISPPGQIMEADTIAAISKVRDLYYPQKKMVTSAKSA